MADQHLGGEPDAQGQPGAGGEAFPAGRLDARQFVGDDTKGARGVGSIVSPDGFS